MTLSATHRHRNARSASATASKSSVAPACPWNPTACPPTIRNLAPHSFRASTKSTKSAGKDPRAGVSLNFVALVLTEGHATHRPGLTRSRGLPAVKPSGQLEHRDKAFLRRASHRLLRIELLRFSGAPYDSDRPIRTVRPRSSPSALFGIVCSGPRHSSSIACGD